MNTKNILTLLLGLVLSSTLSAQSIIGEWKTIDDNTGEERSIVKIYKAKNGKIYGKIVKLLDLSNGENPICDKCPDDRKGKPVLGLVIIKGLSQNGSNWKGGKILDPENGKEYSCKLWLEDGNLKVRGYWGIIYRTQTWYKAS